MMVWCIVGMALERKEPLHQIVNRLDIMLPGNRPFVPPVPLFRPASAWEVRLFGRVFTKTAQLWHNPTPHPHWCGLTLLAIDGVFWRTPDTPENDAAFPRQTHARKPGALPAGQNGLPDGTDQPSADGCSLRHDEEQRKMSLLSNL
ncbi:IS4 orf [Shigella sonnei]|nr:IS4 orf [Shigella sonnei]